MATYSIPFHTTVWTTVEVEASSFDEAYEKGLVSYPPSLENCVLEDQEEWEIDHENIAVVNK